MPLLLTSLVGRERENAEVAVLLRRDGTRPLTLVGPGGVGKTRLALAVETQVAAAISDGVAFVPLGLVRDPNSVTSAIAQVVGPGQVGNRPPVKVIREFVQAQGLLLILDNCEHLIDAGPQIIDLLAACPRLTVLAPSRARLHVSGEHTYQVRPLGHPDPLHTVSVDSVREVAAIQLFLERATAAQDGFTLTDVNLGDIVAICRRRDGLRLAIELAASRVCHLPVAALRARLDPQLNPPGEGSRGQPARLQSMRDAIAWSIDQLTPEEQALPQRLALFVGSATLEAAESISGEVVSNDLVGLASLADKCLLQQKVLSEPHDLKLETRREHGLDRLQSSSQKVQASRKHADHYLCLIEGAEPELQGPNQAAWLNQLEDEHDNLRASLAWACAEGKAELGLRLAGALWRFWMVRGHVAEGRAWLEATLALPSASPYTSTRANALIRVADLVRRCGDEALAHAYGKESLAIRQELGDRAGAASDLTQLGRMALVAGDWAEARAALTKALVVEKQLGEQSRAAQSLLCLGRVAYFEGDLATARQLTEESLALHRALGDSIGVVWALQSLAHTAVAHGAHPEARAAIAEGVAVARGVGYPWGLTVMLEAAAALAAAEARPERALRLAAAAAALREPLSSSLAPDWRADLDHLLAPARQMLSPAAAMAAWAEGRSWSLERALVEAMTSTAASRSASLSSAPGAGLTRREREVLRLLAEGRSNREIGAILSISVQTAKTHVERILSKLGLHSRSAATAYAYKHKLA